MSPTRPHARPRRAPRRGFTMIELMMVVVIIAVLIAILVPAIGAVRARAIESSVKMELSGIEQAIAGFKNVYGVEPPSRLVLCEDASNWTVNEGAATDGIRKTLAEKQRSQAYIRRIWPQFNFSADINVNNNGVDGETLVLTAGECLVFFLGNAVYNPAGPRFEPSGFSKNPSNPFVPGGNREGPHMEFSVDRFVDTDGDFMPEYLDKFPGQQAPLLYFSSYEGKGYDRYDWAYTPMDRQSSDGGVDELTDVYPPSGDDDGPYHLPITSASSPVKYHKAQSFQIISPGWDGDFGWGGQFDPQDLLNSFNDTTHPRDRTPEFDNITNFTEGRLNP